MDRIGNPLFPTFKVTSFQNQLARAPPGFPRWHDDTKYKFILGRPKALKGIKDQQLPGGIFMRPRDRIIHVFESIAHGGIEAVVPFTAPDESAFSLPDAQLMIEPRLKGLEDLVQSLFKDQDLAVINTIRSAEAVSGYIVGVLAGLDLAKRPDIVKQFATMYGKYAAPAVTELFENGNRRAS